ncbi:MAG: hypothetical protein NWE76_08450 [Candidatus Bathyarchaeota archaeon]|nr:hypothetical protein [Candidatus Bathyarchaeota archaeon]
MMTLDDFLFDYMVENHTALLKEIVEKYKNQSNIQPESAGKEVNTI